MGRVIYGTKKQDEFFKIYGDDYKITDDKICRLFGRYPNAGPEFFTTDLIKIDSSRSKYVKNELITTIGIFIFNKACIEHLKVFGYINKSLNGKVISEIDKYMAIALMDDEITTDDYSRYIDTTQYLFGGVLSDIINSSLTSDILNLPDSAKKLRDKLIKENEEALKAGDPMVAAMIEKEVCALAKDEIRKKNPEAMDLFDSDCGVKFDNNYKTMFIMKGAIQDNTGMYSTGYKDITSNYDGGISKEDFPKFADSLITSAYSKGKLTAVGGYSTKKYNAMFQNVHLGKRGSYCGTTRTKKVYISEGSTKYIYRYISVNGKPVLLTNENMPNYYNKMVNMFTPLYCEAKDGEYCNICYGDRKYRLGITNVGLTYNMATNAILNGNMKKFHDITIKLYTIDIDKDIMAYIN